MHDKVEFSCFANPVLRAAASVPDRRTVIFGIEAHVCVLQTAIEVAAAAHDVTIVVDAVGSRVADSKTTSNPE